MKLDYSNMITIKGQMWDIDVVERVVAAMETEVLNDEGRWTLDLLRLSLALQK